jgi:hypothetical protein
METRIRARPKNRKAVAGGKFRLDYNEIAEGATVILPATFVTYIGQKGNAVFQLRIRI